MTYAYWQQWDKGDLDSWQGKDIEPEDDDEDFSPDEDEEEECSCCCAKNPCGNCMDCLGMSWRDFM